MKNRCRSLPLFHLLIALMLAAGLPAAAQTVVTQGNQRVIVDGDTVRVEQPGGVTVVQGGWRQAGDGDTEQILVDLGAVTVEDRIQITLDESVLFDFGSYAVRPDAAKTLAQVAQVIRGRSVGTVYLLGHTDSIGDDAYNRELSRQRAASVMGWLAGNEGIPATIMVGNGMGSSRPVAHNTNPDGSDSPEGRAKNRRVEVQMATSEGVTVGPAVVIAPGGVKVTSEGVSVAGGAVQVDSRGVSVAGGAVQVDEGGVNVGGVRVTNEGVRVGGVNVSGTPAKTGTVSDRSSSGGQVVRRGCYEGDCHLTCRAGEDCQFDCEGGDCQMTCEEGSSCKVACSGGDCQEWCRSGASCFLSCDGGDCGFHCPEGADCRSVTCFGEDCSCSGPAC